MELHAKALGLGLHTAASVEPLANILNTRFLKNYCNCTRQEYLP